MFKADIDKLQESFTQRLETETIKASQIVASLMEEAQRKHQVVSSKFNSQSSSVNESLKVQMPETKQTHEVLFKK
jgi:hypothetical protein